MRAFAGTGMALAAVLTAAAVVSAQESNVFRITVANALSGNEEYQVAATADGYRVTGKVHLERAGGSASDATYEETVTRDRTLVRYKLQAGPQSIEAWRDGDKIQLKVVAGGQDHTTSLPYNDSVIVSDNGVVGDLQVLIDRVAASDQQMLAVTVLVPQAMSAYPAKMSKGQEEQGTLNGKATRVRKYELQVAGLLEELWAEADTNRLVRIAIPLQNAEFVREGFSLAPKTEPQTAGPAVFTERPIDVKNGTVILPGTVCLPATIKGKVPLAVLVHGSGPHDRDETIGPNKPFADIAHGLAAAGIATIRYDKRTFALRGKLDRSLTVEEETIADAAVAVELARTLPEVDQAHVFVLGHSQGAMFAPVIADRSQARGAILLAAAERPLDEVMAEQVAFQMRSAAQPDAEISSRVAELKHAFERVRSGEAKDDEAVVGVSAHYWRSYLKWDTRQALVDTKSPVLILQGGKDVQVRRADYDIAVEAVAKKPAALHEEHFFPNLNHLFMPVEETNPNGAEYGKLSHVDQRVIQVIATWISRQK